MNTSTILDAEKVTLRLCFGKRSNHGPTTRVIRSPPLRTLPFFAEIEFSVGTVADYPLTGDLAAKRHAVWQD
jgi:hypothetical protein